MATINASATTKTATRREQIENLLAFAKQNGYTGEVDKIASLLNTKQSKTNSANTALAHKIAKVAKPDTFYSCKDIAALPVAIPVGSRGKVESSKVTAIMRIAVELGLFKKMSIGSATVYTLA